ncbi:MAG: hypothetical protein WCP22_04065 [Chlamydiota bacterium]
MRSFGYHFIVRVFTPTLNIGKQMNAATIFANIPARIPAEMVERIAHSSTVAVERIISPRGPLAILSACVSLLLLARFRINSIWLIPGGALRGPAQMGSR